VSFVKENGFTLLKGEYIPTLKNDMVKDHYKNLGFEKSERFWILDLINFEEKRCLIIRKNDN
jgi:predicted enzyme involved in methoxymalonyl-ACP biosynthesis